MVVKGIFTMQFFNGNNHSLQVTHMLLIHNDNSLYYHWEMKISEDQY